MNNIGKEALTSNTQLIFICFLRCIFVAADSYTRDMSISQTCSVIILHIIKKSVTQHQSNMDLQHSIFYREREFRDSCGR